MYSSLTLALATNGMRWIQSSLDDTIGGLSAECTRLSRLALILATDGVIQSSLDDTIGSLSAECTRLSRLALRIAPPKTTDGMIQSLWDHTVRCFIAVFAGLSRLAPACLMIRRRAKTKSRLTQFGRSDAIIGMVITPSINRDQGIITSAA